jgi:hypothetical protein
MKVVKSRLAVWYLTKFKGYTVVLQKDIPKVGSFGKTAYSRKWFLEDEKQRHAKN